ncbi:MAG: methyl-accepting chemotaxis sensory transducer [Proteobacteria bacterium]|nr:methyl-accepting chemotaxis sensory transducer [Pseudomonadota bacterium]
MKLTVAKRMIIMTALAVLALLVVGVTGISQLHKASDALDSANTKTIPNILALSEVQYDFMRARATVLSHVVTADLGRKATLETQLNDIRAKINTGLEKYAKELISNETDKTLTVNEQKAIKDYFEVVEKILVHSRKSENAEAVAIVEAAGKEVAAKMQAALVAHMEYNQKLAGNLAAEAKASSTTGTFVSWLAIAIGSLLTAIVGLLTVRTLMRQLGGEPDYAAEVVKIIASGDLSQKITTKPGDESSLLAAMKTMQDNLKQTIAQIKESVETINIASQEIAAGNSDLSQRTEEQASSLEETASSIEELTSTVKQNADNAAHANQLARNASDIASRGGNVVGDVVCTMSGINDASRKIVDIISVIDGIAFQTNILALNAAVEAARAGEQGRGFAVVAGEVRNLAQRSAAAAKEIKGLINDSVERVEDGAKQVEEAGRTMSEIVSSVKRVSEIVDEISNASMEQSAGIEQVNQAIAQMDQVTQQNAALVEEAAAAAKSLEDQAQNLSEAIAVFKMDHTTAGAAIVSSRSRRSSPVSAGIKSFSKGGAKHSAKALPKTVDEEEWQEF